ncbi:hypothetical protein SNE40_005675 [Patella caerulea]|uniref:TASOR pseudo-PARP domain-containing protein n=1 Tax=Patella caerulea TaxID=87958 RepID=A0AAN8K232_PATCE
MERQRKEINFSIPKIKPVKWKDNLREVELTSRDAIDVMNIVDHQAMNHSFKDDWSTRKISLVENSTLETEYREKRKDLKEYGRNTRELTEHYGFLYVKDQYLVAKMVKEGLKAKKSAFNPIGDNEYGIYVCKHPDVQLKIPVGKKEEDAYIIVFKLLLGRCKAVQPQQNVTGEPVPNYDSCSSSLIAQSCDPPNILFARTQIFLYEYSDDALPMNRPRHCLPYAVIKYVNKTNKPKSSPSMTSSPAVVHRRLSSDSTPGYKPGTYGARNRALQRNSLDRPPILANPMSPPVINTNRNIDNPSAMNRFPFPNQAGLYENRPPFYPSTSSNSIIAKEGFTVSSSPSEHLERQNRYSVDRPGNMEEVSSVDRGNNGDQVVDGTNDQQYQGEATTNKPDQNSSATRPLNPLMRKKKKIGATVSDPRLLTPMRRNNLVIERLDYPTAEVVNTVYPVAPVIKTPEPAPPPVEEENKTIDNKADMQKMLETVNKIFGKVPVSDETMDTSFETDSNFDDDDENIKFKGPHTGYDLSDYEPSPKTKFYTTDDSSVNQSDLDMDTNKPKTQNSPQSKPKEIGYVQDLAVQLQSIGDLKDVLSKFNFANDTDQKSQQNYNPDRKIERSFSEDYPRGQYSSDNSNSRRYSCESGEVADKPLDRYSQLGGMLYANNYDSDQDKLPKNLENFKIPGLNSPGKWINPLSRDHITNCFGDKDYRQKPVGIKNDGAPISQSSANQHGGNVDNRSGYFKSQDSYKSLSSYPDSDLPNYTQTSNDNCYNVKQNLNEKLMATDVPYRNNKTNMSTIECYSTAQYNVTPSSSRYGDPQLKFKEKDSDISSTDGFSSDKNDLVIDVQSDKEEPKPPEEKLFQDPKVILLDLGRMSEIMESECDTCKKQHDLVISNVPESKYNDVRNYLKDKGIRMKRPLIPKTRTDLMEEPPVIDSHLLQNVKDILDKFNVSGLSGGPKVTQSTDDVSSRDTQSPLLPSQPPFSPQSPISSQAPFTKQLPPLTQSPISIQSPLPTQSPFPNPSSVSIQSPLPTQTSFPIPSPFSTQYPLTTPSTLSTKSPLTTQSSLSNQSLLPTHSPFPTQSPLSNPSTISTQSSLPVPSPVSTRSPFCTQSQISTQSPLATHSPFITQSLLSTVYPLPTPCQEPVLKNSTLSCNSLSTNEVIRDNHNYSPSVTGLEPLVAYPIKRHSSQLQYPFLKRFKSDYPADSVEHSAATDAKVSDLNSQYIPFISYPVSASTPYEDTSDKNVYKTESSVNSKKVIGRIFKDSAASTTSSKWTQWHQYIAQRKTSAERNSQNSLNTSDSRLEQNENKEGKTEQSKDVPQPNRHFGTELVTQSSEMETEPIVKNSEIQKNSLATHKTPNIDSSPPSKHSALNKPQEIQQENGTEPQVNKTSLIKEIKIVQDLLERLSKTSKSDFAKMSWELPTSKSFSKDDITQSTLKTALLEVEGELIMGLHSKYFMYRPNERIPTPVLFDHEVKCVYATGGCFLYLNTFMSQRLFQSLLQMKKKILDVYSEKQKVLSSSSKVESLNDHLDALLTKRKLLLRTLTGSVKEGRLRQLEKSRCHFLLSIEYMKKTLQDKDTPKMFYLHSLLSALNEHALIVQSELESH